MRRRLPGRSPESVAIRVLAVENVAPGFHAIRDATGKRYRYVIQDGGVPDVFRRHYCWYLTQKLDVAAMQRAAQPLCGTHDFVSFQSSGSPRACTARTIKDLSVSHCKSEAAFLVNIEIEADGFLYNMARSIVGTLVEVGRGTASEGWPAEDRRNQKVA